MNKIKPKYKNKIFYKKNKEQKKKNEDVVFDEMENYTRKMVIDGKVCAQVVICVAGMSATPHQRHPGPTHTNAQARSILKIIWNFTRHEHNENKTF